MNFLLNAPGRTITLRVTQTGHPCQQQEPAVDGSMATQQYHGHTPVSSFGCGSLRQTALMAPLKNEADP
eukprot:5326378-Amphidinium_carterae.1